MVEYSRLRKTSLYFADNDYPSIRRLFFQIGPEFRLHLMGDTVGDSGLRGEIAKCQRRLTYRIDDFLRLGDVKMFCCRKEVPGAEAIPFPVDGHLMLSRPFRTWFICPRHVIRRCEVPDPVPRH